MRRRHFLTLSAATVGGALVYTLDRKPFRVASRSPERKIRAPLRFLTEAEALIIASAASRIFPSDESGPGADEAGVERYLKKRGALI